MTRATIVEIHDEDFHINGRPTYPGRAWRGHRVEGLLLNSRMVQATFDDINPDTQERFAYPDTGIWDADRNTREFIEMLPDYRSRGLLGVTLNAQGGSPDGYSRIQPWINSGFKANGSLRPEFVTRLRQILDRLDDLGMVAILGLFYFGQDEKLYDEAAVKRAVDNAVGFVLDERYTNVVIEINNECDVPRYEHEILQPHRVHELIEQARSQTRDGRRLLVATSYRGRGIPGDKVLASSDLAILHGNGVTDPEYIAEMVRLTRAVPTFRPIPIVFNEDDHFDFEQPRNNMAVAIENHASWGYFDPATGAGGSGSRSDYIAGFQNVPVNWRINTDRKRQFFGLVKEITGV